MPKGRSETQEAYNKRLKAFLDAVKWHPSSGKSITEFPYYRDLVELLEKDGYKLAHTVAATPTKEGVEEFIKKELLTYSQELIATRKAAGISEKEAMLRAAAAAPGSGVQEKIEARKASVTAEVGGAGAAGVTKALDAEGRRVYDIYDLYVLGGKVITPSAMLVKAVVAIELAIDPSGDKQYVHLTKDKENDDSLRSYIDYYKREIVHGNKTAGLKVKTKDITSEEAQNRVASLNKIIRDMGDTKFNTRAAIMRFAKKVYDAMPYIFSSADVQRANISAPTDAMKGSLESQPRKHELEEGGGIKGGKPIREALKEEQKYTLYPLGGMTPEDRAKLRQMTSQREFARQAVDERRGPPPDAGQGTPPPAPIRKPGASLPAKPTTGTGTITGAGPKRPPQSPKSGGSTRQGPPIIPPRPKNLGGGGKGGGHS